MLLARVGDYSTGPDSARQGKDWKMKKRIEHIGHSGVSAVHMCICLREQMEGHPWLAVLVGLAAVFYFVLAVAAEPR